VWFEFAETETYTDLFVDGRDPVKVGKFDPNNEDGRSVGGRLSAI
jgi:hypothetical protein